MTSEIEEILQKLLSTLVRLPFTGTKDNLVRSFPVTQ